MAVIFDSAGAGSNGSSALTSQSMTAGNTAGTFMLAWITTGTSPTNFAMTYNGVSMTEVGTGVAGTNQQHVFKLENPATGSHTLQATWTNGSQSNLGFITFTGVGSVGTPAQASVSSGNTDFGDSVTIESNDMAAGAGCISEGFQEIGVTTGTERAEDGTGPTSGRTINLVTNTGTGSVSIMWNRPGNAATASYVIVPVYAFKEISVSDQLSVSEDVSITSVSGISATDPVGVSESVAGHLVSDISVNDQLSALETSMGILETYINVFDPTSLTEGIVVGVGDPGAKAVDVFDPVSVSDTGPAETLQTISVFDLLGSLEAVTMDGHRFSLTGRPKGRGIAGSGIISIPTQGYSL